jgi:hypothetical protein
VARRTAAAILFSGQVERVGADDEARYRRCLWPGWQEDVADVDERDRITRKPSDRVEGRGEGDYAVGRYRAVGRPHPVEAAECRGEADGTARVGAERKIRLARGNRHGGAAGGATGQPVGCCRVDRRAVVRVRAFEAEGEFVGDGRPDKGSTRGEQSCNGLRVGRRGVMRREPVGIAAAGGASRHVDEILHGEGQAGQRPRRRGRHAVAPTGHKRAEWVFVRRHGVRCGAHAAFCPESAPRMPALSVTKPKHFLTFQIVASVQKAGEDVAQQSVTMMQP